jgi:hypothetical protein
MQNNLPDLSEIEDSPDGFEIISRIAVVACQNAAAEARAAGWPLIFVRANQLIRQDSGGKETVLKAGREGGNPFYYEYEPGIVLNPKFTSAQNLP